MSTTLIRLVIAAAMVLAISLSTAVVTAQSSPTQTPGSALTINTGNGETGYDVDLYLPSEATIQTGTTVTFQPSGTWPEPHTVTVGQPQGNPTTPINVPASGPMVFDGTQSFSSGTITATDEGFPPFAKSFQVTFNRTGVFRLNCAYHENMAATITVVDSGSTDSQATLTARGQTEFQQALAGVKAAAAGLTAAPPTTNPDGTKHYSVIVGKDATNGVATQFFAPTINVNVGDSVTWTNPSTDTPHTVTFHPELFQGNPLAPVPPVTAPFNGTGLANSGLIGFSPVGPVPASFTLVFSSPGTFQYVCLLHDDEGMVGTVNVGTAGASATPRPPATGNGTQDPGGPSWWGLVGLMVAASGALGCWIAIRIAVARKQTRA